MASHNKIDSPFSQQMHLPITKERCTPMARIAKTFPDRFFQAIIRRLVEAGITWTLTDEKSNDWMI